MNPNFKNNERELVKIATYFKKESKRLIEEGKLGEEHKKVEEAVDKFIESRTDTFARLQRFGGGHWLLDDRCWLGGLGFRLGVGNRCEFHFWRSGGLHWRGRFDDWRFNLRGSNTEPVIRLNVETRGDRALMEAKTAELLALIRE